MDSYKVQQSSALDGEVVISGAKNAVLPLMAAALLAPGSSLIENVPDLKDVRTMADVLRVIGAKIKFENGEMRVDASQCDHLEAPYELVKTMRASIYVLGPLLARFGYARVSMPGGCAWGPRPVDLHIKGLEALGAEVIVTHGYIEAKADRLPGGNFDFPVVSVGATANILMAAVLAEGKSILENTAVEPEIDALVDYLIGMGARIKGRGTRRLEIDGVPALRPGSGKTIPDRIEAGTFLVAGAITRGRVKILNVNPGHLKKVNEIFVEMGAEITQGEDWVEIDTRGKTLKAVDITTMPFPGFPTDMQPQFMALLATCEGRGIITETIYLDRYKHISELQRLGAEITLREHTAIVDGGVQFSGAPVMASDLRAGAAMCLAGLVSEGETEVSRIYHMDRGYERFSEKVKGLGGTVTRITGAEVE